MPKAVQRPLGCVAILLVAGSALGMLAFPLVLAIKFPTQATADFLGALALLGGAMGTATSVYSWLRHRSRPEGTLQPRFPVRQADVTSLL